MDRVMFRTETYRNAREAYLIPSIEAVSTCSTTGVTTQPKRPNDRWQQKPFSACLTHVDQRRETLLCEYISPKVQRY